jgi:hypothetical protein
MDFGGAILKYVTAQPFAKLNDGKTEDLFFETTTGIAPEFVFSSDTLASLRTDNKSGSQAMCEAAAQNLHDAQTNIIELAMTLDARGRVQSFTTVSPKGLRLEKMKKAADEIKAMQFEPATKDGHPVAVMIRATFKCSTTNARSGQ